MRQTCGHGTSVCWIKKHPLPIHPFMPNQTCQVSQVLATMGPAIPLLNGNYTFLTGTLDQSFWPDGLYTAPTDAGLEYDLVATKS